MINKNVLAGIGLNDLSFALSSPLLVQDSFKCAAYTDNELYESQELCLSVDGRELVVSRSKLYMELFRKIEEDFSVASQFGVGKSQI